MLERYKLRLGDGTIVGVDRDGLSTWAVDRRAMVQSAGSGQWQPLSEFLARRRTAAGAAGQKSNAREGVSGDASPRPLPLVYPKAKQSGPAPAEPAPVPEPEAVVVAEPIVPATASEFPMPEAETEAPFIAEAP